MRSPGGVTVMAATDHDTTAACTEVVAVAREFGIEAITGIEITAVENQRDIHVLGYFVDPENEHLAAFLAKQRTDRIARLEAMGERLERLGVPVDVAAILERGRDQPGRSLGRPQLARAMVAAGHVANTREAFERFLIEGTPGFVSRTGASIDAVIDVIHRAGGLASVAHPGKTRIDERLASTEGRRADALEVFHPDHDPAMVASYTDVANDLGLLMTGGSDFHGDPAHGLIPGSVTLPAEHWDRLLNRHRQDGRV
jgi:predicted metal-dependent phosphoesterase TrpH